MTFHSRRATRGVVTGAALALVAGTLSVTALGSPASAADPVTITLLNINDFHGRIDNGRGSGGTPDSVNNSPLTVKLAGTVEEQRAADGANGANTLFLSAGDNVSASLYASSSAMDQPTIDVLNALDLSASAVGNHELDKGYDDLVDRIIGGQDPDPDSPPEIEPADFDYLAANIYAAGTTDLAPGMKAYETYTAGGLDVAVIGAITQETETLVSPDGIAELDFGDPVDAVNDTVDEIEALPAEEQPDVIVAEYHEGAPDSETATSGSLEEEVAKSPVFASIVNETDPEVDAIFTGHSHKSYTYDGPIAGTDQTRPILQTGSYGDNVGKVTLTVDTDDADEVSAYTAVNVPRTTTSETALLTAFPRVVEVKQIVDAAVADAAVVGRVPIGSVEDDITTAYRGGSYVDGVYTGGTRDDRGSESTLGNLVGNALRDTLAPPRLGGADIGVVNPGGLRAELLYAGSDQDTNTDGVITKAEANAVLPFANNLDTTTLTGAQFVTLLEQQWQRTASGGLPSSNPFLKLGLSDNVSYTYDTVQDPEQAPGVLKGVISSVTIDGQPLDPEAEYRIGTFNFLTAGGDNFRVLAQGANRQDSGLVDIDGWFDYLDANPGLEPSFARRAVKVTGYPTEPLEGGDEVTMGLSQLDLTSQDSPLNTSVEARYGDEVLSSFQVTDGAASVDFLVPTDANPATPLRLVALPSGTTVTLPVAKADAVVSGERTDVVYGKVAQVPVTVTGAGDGGTVTITAGARELGSAPVEDGAAVVRVPTVDLRAGAYQLGVEFSGDDAANAATGTVALRITKAPTRTNGVKVAPATLVAGKSSPTFSATVRSGKLSVGGTVEYRTAGKTKSALVGDDGVVPSRVFGPYAKAGEKTVTVVYLGNGRYQRSVDTFTVQVVKQK